MKPETVMNYRAVIGRHLLEVNVVSKSHVSLGDVTMIAKSVFPNHDVTIHRSMSSSSGDDYIIEFVSYKMNSYDEHFHQMLDAFLLLFFMVKLDRGG